MTVRPLELIPDALVRAAARNPDHPALRMSGASMSYGELVARCNRVANTLLAHGVRKGDRVGLYAHKSIELFVALFGIMRAGAVYVPINPDAPAAYLQHIIEDCDIRHLVISKSTLREANKVAPGTGIEVIIGAADRTNAVRSLTWEDVWAAPSTDPAVAMLGDDLAYIIFTSGSTGRPKGITHTHRSGLAYGEVGSEAYGFRPEDRIANHAPLNFDLCLLELWGGVVAGSTIVVIPEAHARLPASFSQMLMDEQVSVVNAVPFALVQLANRGALEERDLSSLRWVIFGGEVYPTRDLRALMLRLPHARFANVYGPAEVNGVTYHVVPEPPPQTDEPIPIGGLYPGMRALVLGSDDREVDDGEVGELVIDSPTRMVGYWNQPELTARSTYERSAADGTVERWHRTGDLVSRQPDGSFRLVGRKDRLVKIRGNRIELDEVEVVLSGHPDVEQAAVFVVPDQEGSHQIEAAIVLTDSAAARSGSDTATDVKRHLAALLPKYAVPRHVRVATALPRTSSGKADRPTLIAEAARVHQQVEHQ